MIPKNVDDLTSYQVSWYRKHVTDYVGDFRYIRFEDDDRWTDDVKTKIILLEKGKDVEFFPFKFKDCRKFCCYNFPKLKSLEGSPDSVYEDFLIWGDDSLESLDGISKFIGNNLDISFCRGLKSIESLLNVKIKGKIECGLDKYLKNMDLDSKMLMSNMNVFRTWQRSGSKIDQFMKNYSGFMDGQKYGI